MKKSHIISLAVVLAVIVALVIAFSCSRHSGLTGMWVGTHHLVSSTDGVGSFNSKSCQTFCSITEKDGQVTGSITMFGLDSHAFRDTEELHGTIHSRVIEWKSGRSWEDANRKTRQYETLFHGTQNGDTISGHFEQTWNVDGKTVTYGGVVELKKQPNKSPEPTAVGAGSSAVAVHVASRRWLSFFR
jgi:hypothetical protein